MSLLEIANIFHSIEFVSLLLIAIGFVFLFLGGLFELGGKIKTAKAMMSEIDGWANDDSVSDAVKVEQIRTILQFRKSMEKLER